MLIEKGDVYYSTVADITVNLVVLLVEVSHGLDFVKYEASMVGPKHEFYVLLEDFVDSFLVTGKYRLLL